MQISKKNPTVKQGFHKGDSSLIIIPFLFPPTHLDRASVNYFTIRAVVTWI
jgi:hypothetical protein